MAKLKCRLLNIFGVKEQQDALLRRLQEMAVIDLETAASDAETSVIPNGYFSSADENNEEFVRRFQKADSALKFLSERFPESRGLLSFLSGPRMVKNSDFYLDEKAQKNASAIAEEIISLEKSITENRSEILKLNTQVEQLTPWKELDIPTNFTGTETTDCLIGTVQGNLNVEELSLILTERLEDTAVYIETVFTLKDITGVFLCFNSSNKSRVEDILRDLGFARPSVMCSVKPMVKLSELEENIKNLEEREKTLINQIETLSVNRSLLENYSDYCRAESERLSAKEKLALTENTILIRGYIAEQDYDLLYRELNREFTVCIESEPVDENLAPVKLKNNAFAAPAETITRMYSLPSATDIDPTPLTGFFYYFLFGMMLSDAGYGLLMIIGTLFALKKFNPAPNMRNTIKLFLYCGISTFVWGLIFGSFFGDSIAVISETFFGKRIALPALIDPMNGGAVQMLILSLGIGLVQIIAGLGAKFVTLYKNGDKAGAFFDAGFWITTLIGVGILAIGIFALKPLVTVGAVISLLSILGLILTQGRAHKNPVLRLLIGVKSLYDITSYVSDLLSFSRLMALGLTTAAMGAVFNLLGTLAGGGIAGALLMLIIFPVGHAISFALNVLGAYVHTLRLQYVELFSKFYDGGGREFKSFSIKNKYVGIEYDNKEEN